MKRIARINQSTNKVENIEVWKEMPSDTSKYYFKEVSVEDEVGSGYTYSKNDSEFKAPVIPVVAELPDCPQEPGTYKLVVNADKSTQWILET